MAQVTDLSRLHVLSGLFTITDKNGRHFIHVFPQMSWSDLKIKFGKPTRSGLSRASIVVKVYYNGAMSTYTFYLIYDHVKEDWHSIPCQFLSVSIDCEFSASQIISINNFKLDGLWDFVEEGVVPVVGESAGVCPEAVDDKFASNESCVISVI